MPGEKSIVFNLPDSTSPGIFGRMPENICRSFNQGKQVYNVFRVG